MQAIAETVFDIIYLTLVITVGIQMILKSHGNKQYKLFGIMAVTLGAGDTFHLIPRALALCTTGLDSFTAALGIGKWITSITMTIFYVLLYYVWRIRYKIQGNNTITWIVYLLAAARIALCMFPQNAWTQADAPLSWGIYRNIPFALLGLLIIILFYRSAKQRPRFCLDVAFHCTQLWILYPCGTLGRQHPINWHADDSKDLCLCLGCFDGIFRYAPS